MNVLKRVAKSIPGARPLYRSFRGAYVGFRMKANPAEYVFTDIYRRRLWGDRDSVSGPGSDREQTRAIIEELPALLDELGVSTLLDLPCGDFHWMSTVELGEVEYIGADIVKALVRRNAQDYSGPRRSFRHLNLLEDPLPRVDLVLCRDCLVHFSFDDVFRALANLCRSGSRYLLATHFTGPAENSDIVTGDWRLLNLEREPFLLPAPRRVLMESCTLEEGRDQGKCLALWDLEGVGATLDGRAG